MVCRGTPISSASFAPGTITVAFFTKSLTNLSIRRSVGCVIRGRTRHEGLSRGPSCSAAPGRTQRCRILLVIEVPQEVKHATLVCEWLKAPTRCNLSGSFTVYDNVGYGRPLW